jgi:hypothetical protein
VSALPNTTTKGVDRRWPLYVLVAVVLVALALVLEAFLRAENFLPGEDIYAPGIRDVTISSENSLYPPPDTARFEVPPEMIFVYLSVEELPSVQGIEARVERAESGSAFSLLFDRGTSVEVLDEQEDQLSTGENGATGIMKFTLEATSGEPMPPGNYTVEIYGPSATGDEDTLAVRKLFVVEE